MSIRLRNPYLLLALLVAIVSVPFLDQAIHIDDRIYLEVADNILKRPLHPYDYRPIFEGFEAEDAASHSHLPLTSYYLALLQWVTGSSREWVFHLGFMVFSILAAWGMYELACGLVRFPLAAAAGLVLSPAFLVLSHTLMTDIPLLSLWLLSFSRFLALQSGETNRRNWLVFAVSLAAAAFISVTTMLPITFFATSAWLSSRPEGPKERHRLFVILLAPFVLWALWFFFAYVHYGRFVLVNTFLHMSQRDTFAWGVFGLKLLSFVLNVGAVFLLPPVLWYGLGGRWSARLAAVVLMLTFIPLYAWVTGWFWPQTLLFAVFLSTGFLVVLTAVKSLVQTILKWVSSGARTVELSAWGLLNLWFVGTVFVCLVLYYSGSVRYVLPALPFVLLLWIRSLESKIKDEYLLRNVIWLGVVLTGVYSLWLSCGDYRFAETYRDAARELTTKYGGRGKNIWIAGEWGFRYYMNQAGARTLLQTGAAPQPGDIVIKPYVAMPWVTLYDEKHLDLVEQHYAKTDFSVRILDFNSHAGFYSTGWGLLPFSLKKGEKWEWFNVFRVKAVYQGVIPEQKRPW